MPTPSEFRKAFRLGEGEEVGALGRVAACTVGHEVKKRYERYDFPTTLTLELAPGRGGRGPSARQIEAAVRAHAGGPQLVYSSYGSPYSCSIASVKVSKLEGEEATVRLLGRAERRRNVPTLAQRKEAEQQEKGEGAASSKVSKEGERPQLGSALRQTTPHCPAAPATPPADEQRWLTGMRVTKSRFGTSKCADCGQAIDPGDKIARDVAATQRGGWVHTACAVAGRKRRGVEGDTVEGEKRTKGRKKRARKES